MFPLMICAYECFPEGYNSLNYHSCDIQISNTCGGIFVLSCIMSYSVWVSIMKSIFNAGFVDRCYLYPARCFGAWKEENGYTVLRERGYLKRFSPPIGEEVEVEYVSTNRAF